MSSGGISRPLLAVLVGAVLASVGGCSPGREDPVAASAVAAVTTGLEQAVAGWSVTTRTELEVLVQGARGVVVDPERDDVGFSGIDYATYGTTDQERTRDDAVSIAVWHSTVGGGPFVDDGGAWHVVCAGLSVDRWEASLVGRLVECPDGMPAEPPLTPESGVAAHLDLEAPTGGAVAEGRAGRTGTVAQPLRPAEPVSSRYPCLEEDLDAALEHLRTSVGPSDLAVLRVVNTGSLACTVRGVDAIALEQDGRGTPVAVEGGGGPEVTLRPRESTSAEVSWRPTQRVNHAVAQRITVTLGGGVTLAVHHGSPGSAVPIPVDPGGLDTVGRWGPAGYGTVAGDETTEVGVAPRCDPADLAVLTVAPDPAGSGSPTPPEVDLVNIGVRPCRTGPAESLRVEGAPGFAQAPTVALQPGTGVRLVTTEQLPDRPDQVLVGGRWVAMAPQ